MDADDLRTAAQDVVGAEVWIEQVRLAVSSPVDRSRLAEGQDAVAELVRLVDELAADPALLADWSASTLGEVWHKLPAEVLAGSDVPRLADTDDMRSLLREAEATLLARLASP